MPGASFLAAKRKVAVTDTERALALLLAAATIVVMRELVEAKPPSIRPTMRPDPQTAAATHGTLMSHAQA